LVGELIWFGYQNWPMEAKITTEGIEENEFNKKVYYTDAFNVKRLVNLKDNNLYYRQGYEFNQILDNTLRSPEIIGITSGGQLNAMKVYYTYRVISENGQVSNFSPASEFIDILKEDEAIEYRGGSPGESTNKKVEVICGTDNLENNAEIQCFAVEFEGTAATAIRNLGIKPARTIVSFFHLGNEPIDDTIVFDDIVNSGNTWKYCNDFQSEKNKIIAVGLRNNPLPTIFNQLEYLMALKSWDVNGNSHNCVYNPEPWNYRYIDPTNTDELYYTKKRIYYTISSFGPTVITLRNKLTDDTITINFDNLSIDSYTDITSEIIEQLLLEQDNNLNWETYFPNLVVTNSNNNLLFSPIDDTIETNMDNYVIESSNEQTIINFDIDLSLNEVTINTDNLVYGAKSLGFDSGTGIRVTYRRFSEPLLDRAQAEYTGTDNLLNYYTPSGTKYAMKGEIYRLAFIPYNLDSTNLFTIPMGDVMIPNANDIERRINDAGDIILTSQKYHNQTVENGVLMGHGIKLHIEVRLSCELQNFISMYQIGAVERTEDNRTILCQGIAQPLMRIQHNDLPENKIPEPLLDKWQLPYNGGPLYEVSGMVAYDNDGEDFQLDAAYNPPPNNATRLVMYHRKFVSFDSPDLYYDRISEKKIEQSQFDIIARLKTDHTPEIIANRGTSFADMTAIAGNDLAPIYYAGVEEYPKFSRKIKEDYIENIPGLDPLPNLVSQSRLSFDTFRGYFINCSVYSTYEEHSRTLNIDKYRQMLRGEVVSGQAFDLENGVSNNAFALPYHPWFYSFRARNWDYVNGDPEDPRATLFRVGLTSPGYKSVFIKTSEDIFTSDFIGPPRPQPNPQTYPFGTFTVMEVSDAIPLVNLFLNNRDSVYGGRTKEAYSRNTFIPFTKAVPVPKTSNLTQIMDAGIDSYMTLNIRIKNDNGDESQDLATARLRDGNAGGDFDVFRKRSAWIYACVVETQVEPKHDYEDLPYRKSVPHTFDVPRSETINPCYFNVNNSKSFIPKPFNFKDDPNQINEIAVSDIKVAGESIDNWTVFKVNNFYDLLDKNKGAATNIVKARDNLIVVQEHQNSQIFLGEDRLIQDEEGNPINIKQGSGSVIGGHKVLGQYGTSIRRAVSVSETGEQATFTFYDERKNELIRNNTPLLFTHSLALEYLERFKNNKIVDTEIYYSDEEKETNICLTSKDGSSFILSYNEAEKVFNGEIEMSSNHFIEFDNKIYIPNNFNSKAAELHIANAPDRVLNFLNSQKKLVVGVTVNADIDKVLQHRKLHIITDSVLKAERIDINSNIGYDRIIDDSHLFYKLKEGYHSVPTINKTTSFIESSSVRGHKIYLEITFAPTGSDNIKISGLVHGVRLSHT